MIYTEKKFMRDNVGWQIEGEQGYDVHWFCLLNPTSTKILLLTGTSTTRQHNKPWASRNRSSASHAHWALHVDHGWRNQGTGLGNPSQGIRQKAHLLRSPKKEPCKRIVLIGGTFCYHVFRNGFSTYCTLIILAH